MTPAESRRLVFAFDTEVGKLFFKILIKSNLASTAQKVAQNLPRKFAKPKKTLLFRTEIRSLEDQISILSITILPLNQ